MHRPASAEIRRCGTKRIFRIIAHFNTHFSHSPAFFAKIQSSIPSRPFQCCFFTTNPPAAAAVRIPPPAFPAARIPPPPAASLPWSFLRKPESSVFFFTPDIPQKERHWIPAFAGMTSREFGGAAENLPSSHSCEGRNLIRAKHESAVFKGFRLAAKEIPAFAGMGLFVFCGRNRTKRRADDFTPWRGGRRTEGAKNASAIDDTTDRRA